MSTKSDDFQGAISMARHLGKEAAKRGDQRLSESDRLDLCAEMRVESWNQIETGHQKKFQQAFRRGIAEQLKREPERNKGNHVETDSQEGVAHRAHQSNSSQKHLPKTKSRGRSGSRKSSPSQQLQRRTAKA